MKSTGIDKQYELVQQRDTTSFLRDSEIMEAGGL